MAISLSKGFSLWADGDELSVRFSFSKVLGSSKLENVREQVNHRTMEMGWRI